MDHNNSGASSWPHWSHDVRYILKIYVTKDVQSIDVRVNRELIEVTQFILLIYKSTENH